MKHGRSLALAMVLCANALFAKDEPLMQIGVARIDITPNYPIRLSGYGARRTNSEDVAQKIFAKALAFGSDKEGASILFTVDNCGVPGSVTDEVAARLKKRAGIPRERVALCSSHTHSAPMLTGVLPFLFSMDIPADQQATIDRYTRELTDKLERLAIDALSNRAPAKLSWTEGTVNFAKNRRVVRGTNFVFGDNDTGPVDHTFAALLVRGADDKLRAVLGNYACHCTTLSANQIHGDWSGCAQEAIERDNPGAIALISIGGGADANPSPRGKLENAVAHGDEIAAEVRRLLALPSKPLAKFPEAKLKRFDLDFDPLPTREQWEERATKPGIVGYHAKKNLARLDHGEKLPTKLPYVAQTWTFDDQLAMVFLAGEVVVDYELRLKREFDRTRLWVNGYANDVPCYIPSRRILAEGGYEAEDSLWYYDRPARLATNSEDRIIKAVHDLLPRKFAAKGGGARAVSAGTRSASPTTPLSPKQALNSMRVAPEFVVDLVAAEPLVVDPVAIDWGADGKLWVVEMRDYPMGLDGKWKPGGVVKFLEDKNGDGRYDKATVFLDNLPFPTGVFAWRKGVLICAAPDILYAEDTDGDGRADVVRKIFTGFATNNYQARVNSLSLGLDNWIYGANGLLGGKIERRDTTFYLSLQRGEGRGEGWEHRAISDAKDAAGRTAPHPNPLPVEGRGNQNDGPIDIRGRDFRMNPDTGAFEPASGLTQQGRVRDDFGNWFGCDNTHQLWHYPLADEYLRRNPRVTAPAANVQVPQGREWNRVFPASRTLERFNSPESANHITSGCGVEIFRDASLGQEFYGNAFTCEPVHNLVHREVLTPDGVTFRSTRATNELDREFLASTDNWFRPVQVRTGPDGALWIVDMYRFVIEHPRWIPSNRLAQLDVRAGEDKGRIYRVYRKGSPPRPIKNFAKLSTPQLAVALDSPNGTERDIIHRELLNRGDGFATPQLVTLAKHGTTRAVRVQALSALDGLHALNAALLSECFRDTSPAVRECVLRLAESQSKLPPGLAAATHDENLRVRFQATLSLAHFPGAMRPPDVTDGLSNVWFRIALAVTPETNSLLEAATHLPSSAQQIELIEVLLSNPNFSSASDLASNLMSLLPANAEQLTPWRFRAATKLLGWYNELERPNRNVVDPKIWESPLQRSVAQTRQLARECATNENANVVLRRAAIGFLGHCLTKEDAELFDRLFGHSTLQEASLDALSHANGLAQESELNQRDVARVLVRVWPKLTPRLRDQAAELCAARTETADVLLSAAQQRVISPAEISLSLQNRFLKSSVPEIRKAAEALWRRDNPDRAKLVAGYRKEISAQGSASRGAEVFDKTCASCHALNGHGNAVGPDLSALRDKSAEDFLVAILDPNAAIEPRFVNYNIETKDGRSLSGVIRSETATGIELVAPGLHETLLRADIGKIEASSLSLMPEGLEQGITPAQMSDLIAFLKSSPTTARAAR